MYPRTPASRIARLNHGYGVGGTIPRSDKYADFAHRCANWVARSQGCKIWVIGNEPNNPREHPSGEQITPERFATCFNLVYEAIKGVQSDAIVTLHLKDELPHTIYHLTSGEASQTYAVITA